MRLHFSGNIIDIVGKGIFKGSVTVEGTKIISIEETATASDKYILPGFVDAHVHIESSMLVPSEFARLAVVHGTVASVSDPHEIANVLGMEGVNFMIENGNSVPFKFFFGAPSCVPATIFETAGSQISLDEIEELFKHREIKYLAEMMNWPGVLADDPSVMAKIQLAKQYGKVIDGHAPGLRGDQAKMYVFAGMSTDHECFTKDEALEKLSYGMKILIREGSAAKNFEALFDLINFHEDHIMFCSDDKHPNDLVLGHINDLVKRALHKKIDLFKVLKVACVNPVIHYGLEVGLLKVNDPADFIIVDNLSDFNVLETHINGELVARAGTTLMQSRQVQIINKFDTLLKATSDFKLYSSSPKTKVIEALDGQLVTNLFESNAKFVGGALESDPDSDILKIVVVNRYKNAPPAIAFIKNFGLKEGALASCIAHDSHNIIAVGVSDESICIVINEIIANKGGVALNYRGTTHALPLPIAGLMTDEDGYKVASKYTEMDKLAKAMGTTLSSPFMTLSFMTLLVIPSAKLSDLGLFDSVKFEFINNEVSTTN